ncbi:hypothetical protein DAPPUDRAFT_112594 [Daphnia pulex]|uniref:Uncharacterized protein n=1 Tax=Daphnia pulex TaxID=6669 RepID=E9HCL6_DAPPU|nr:hypothetical protein DAPPUDRAFT_112594 [Daphnia pulex]|eukprot:EFX70498.1 hypothetical protein DAPPUDRAFT_112594 [Daphnia pulex]
MTSKTNSVYLFPFTESGKLCQGDSVLFPLKRYKAAILSHYSLVIVGKCGTRVEQEASRCQTSIRQTLTHCFSRLQLPFQDRLRFCDQLRRADQQFRTDEFLHHDLPGDKFGVVRLFHHAILQRQGHHDRHVRHQPGRTPFTSGIDQHAVASPLALLIYRRIQLGPTTQLLDPGIAAPLFILIFYVMFLLYARVKLDGFFPAWLRHLLKLRLNDIMIEDDVVDEESADSMSHEQHEYDPAVKIRAAEMTKAKV